MVKKRKYVSSDEGTDIVTYNADQLGDCLFLSLFKKFTIFASGHYTYSSTFQTKQNTIANRKAKKFS